jgi:hypothetical protein
MDGIWMSVVGCQAIPTRSRQPGLRPTVEARWEAARSGARQGSGMKPTENAKTLRVR